MNDNFIPKVTHSLFQYENKENRLREQEERINKLQDELIVYETAMEENIFLHSRINELEETVSRLSRIVDGLQVQHRNDQGLD